jgi:hypothetical protein
VQEGVISEIENKFFWIKVSSGAQADYYWLFNRLDIFLEKIVEWTERMAKNNQLPSDVTREQL